MPAVLTASGVHAGQPEVLTGIDLNLTEGDPPLGLIGPSGSGKTTLVHVLAGHIRPTRGRVTFDGQAITRRRGAGARDMRASVRFVSQDSLTVTDPRETVTGRLTQATKVARRAGRTHPLDPEELLAATGLPPQFLGRRTLTLSGGERQRLALATALATRPRILLLDEPLTALDPHARLAITRRLTQTVARLGIGVLLASHDLELIARMCPQAVFLSGGRLVERGPVGDLLGRSSHPVIRDLAEHTPFRG